MELLFASYISPEEAANKEVKRFKKKVSINGDPPEPKPKARAWWDIFVEQVINAAIVGGIVACSTAFDDWEIPAKAFGITFLVELRKYRKL
ncbi:MAG: hypothetical protein A2Y91_03435 [Chloroflexi bacterium RBG_13_54_8]|nr:MAG: hypothetical protein A2Y91_03435 [Chloroflexi bacterium RBG_13_54_8]